MKHYILGTLFTILLSANLFGQKAEEHQHTESSCCTICKERITAKVIYSFGVTYLNLDESENKIEVKFRKMETNSSKIKEILISAGYRFRIVEEDDTYFEAMLYPCKHKLDILAKVED